MKLQHTLVALLVAVATAAVLAQGAAPARPAPAAQKFTVVEATIAEMRTALEERRVTSREIVQQYLDAHRDLRGQAARGAHRESERAQGSRRARSRARRGPPARSAARHSDRAEGQHPHDDDADDRRGAGVRWLRAAVRSDADDEPARGRRDHHRQDRHDRAGQLGRRCADTDADQLQRGRRLRHQPVRSAPRSAAAAPTAGRCWRPADRARASAPRRTSGRPTSGPKRRARSSARPTRTCWRASSRRSAASAATASFRSRPIRTRPGRWRSR